MDFQLDTSGTIDVPNGVIRPLGKFWSWADLTPFAQGYTAALLSEPDTARLWWMLAAQPADDHNTIPFRFLAPETLARIIADCGAFPTWSGRCDRSQHAGEVFYAQRQRGQWPDTWPPLNVQLCDDGKVRFA